MKKYLLDLLICGYSSCSIFCKKKNKSVDNKKIKDKKQVQDISSAPVIKKDTNTGVNTDINNNQQVYSLKRMIENYPELASGFLDNLKAVNYQKNEDSIVNLICRSKENIDIPNENKVDNKSKNKKNKKDKNKKEESKNDVSIKKITKYDNVKCQGFFVSNDGYIVADYSLINNCKNISVVDPKDITKEIPATIVGYDDYLNIILLKADIKTDNFIGFTEYDKSKKFKYVQNIRKGEYKCDGYTEVEFNNTSNNNKKDSKKGGNIVNTKTFNSYSDIRSDIKTSLLINIDGYLIGMRVYGGKYVNNSISGYNSILPYNYIYKAINEFISKKYYVHDYNIFGLVSVDERIKALKRLKLDKGCVVETVSQRLEQCGLKVNDIIVEINGNTVDNIKEFDRMFTYYNSDEIKLKVNREGKEIILTLKDGICGAVKYEYINNGIKFNGATITNIDKVLVDSYNRSKNFNGGVLISDIVEKDKWNCNSNFVITKIKDIPVKSVDDVVNILKMLNKSYKINNDFDGISLLIEGFYTKDINNKKCFGILLK